jgi:hypothetical protein
VHVSSLRDTQVAQRVQSDRSERAREFPTADRLALALAVDLQIRQGISGRLDKLRCGIRYRCVVQT